jgi:phosphosulfolactate phosphohydrolase-like enzyme
LLQLVELEMQRNPSSPAVRLDTSRAVAAEVVAALRQGTAYMLPVGDRRLLTAVKHQLDYLGVQLQPAAGDQQYLVVPAYDLAGGARPTYV